MLRSAGSRWVMSSATPVPVVPCGVVSPGLADVGVRRLLMPETVLILGRNQCGPACGGRAVKAEPAADAGPAAVAALVSAHSVTVRNIAKSVGLTSGVNGDTVCRALIRVSSVTQLMRLT